MVSAALGSGQLEKFIEMSAGLENRIDNTRGNNKHVVNNLRWTGVHWTNGSPV